MPKHCSPLPHGIYSLMTAMLTTMGWIAALFENSCNFALIAGDIVNEVSVQEVPFLQFGVQAYRAPQFNVDTTSWHTTRTGQCISYPTNVNIDLIWKISNAFTFAGLVLGGGATFYLWISTFCRFSRGSWRCAGYEVAAACFFQSLSFVWFATDVCTRNHCMLSYGSKADIVAAVFWLLAAILIFTYYPKPKELIEADGIMICSSETDRESKKSGQIRRLHRTIEGTTPELVDTEVGSQDVPVMAAGQNSQQEECRDALHLGKSTFA
jgi:hypothetical protein